MISHCRSCLSTKLYTALSLGEQYLSDFIEEGERKPMSFPLNLVMCMECDLVQLGETTPHTKLYHDRYGYYSGVSDTIRADLRDIVDKAMQRVKVHEGDVVIDIGSNDGTLLKNYPEQVMRIGFDPVSKFQQYYDNIPNLTFFNDYFSFGTYSRRFPQTKAKIITAISMFYDLDEPNAFVADLAKALHPQGLLIIQQNYLGSMIQNMAFDNIVHEHLEYYSLTSLSRLLNRHGLDVVDVYQNSINGGSFRAYVKHMDNVKKMRINEKSMKLNNKMTYFLFGMRVKQAANKLYRFIKGEVESGKKVYVYGASTRGNTLLQAAGLDHTLIKAAVERNPVKFGKLIASVDIPIISEEQARKEKPDYFLVLPWFNKAEIVRREEEFIKQGGSLLFPLPSLTVVNAQNFSNHSVSKA